MAHSSVFGTGVIVHEPTELYRDYGVTHVLRGKLQIRGKSLSVSSYLIEANTGAIVWTDRDERRVEEILDVEPDLVRRVALSLGAQLDFDEAMRLQRRYTNDPKVLKLFSDAMRLLHPPSHNARMMAGRELFEQTVTLDPSFAPGYAGRSLNYSTGVIFGLSQSPQRDSQKAIELARIALDLDSTLGLGHAALGVAYAASGRLVEALTHARRAVELDPGDAASHAHLGGVLIQSGRPDEAIEQMAEAIRLNPIQVTSPFLNLLGCAYLNAGRDASAVEAFTRNNNRGGPRGPPMDAMLAAAYAELGLEAEALAAISNIVMPPTEFPVGNFLRQWIPADELQRRTFANLRRIGLAFE
jgi:tetratricopeptide (TPR) repeat protein